MLELWACKGLINLDLSYVGSILVKGKIKILIPNNSSSRAALKAIFWVLVSPYPTTTMCKISGQMSTKSLRYCSPTSLVAWQSGLIYPLRRGLYYRGGNAHNFRTMKSFEIFFCTK